MKERAKQLANKLDNVTSETTDVWNEESTVKVYNGFSEFEFSWRQADWIYDLYNSGKIDGQDELTSFIHDRQREA
jgi:hypothetical protein